MQEKQSIMVVRCELKIPSLGITVPLHELKSYPCHGIFKSHLTTIKDSYRSASDAAEPGIWVGRGDSNTKIV